MKNLLIIIALLFTGVAFAGGPIVVPNQGGFYSPPPQVYIPKPPPVYKPPPQPVQKYNPFQNRHETTMPNSKLKYNPFNNTYQYVTPPVQGPTYNPFSNEYEYPR